MNWVVIAIATVASVEIFFRLPLLATIHRFTNVFGRAIHYITTNAISDHWKEVVIPRLSLRMLGYCLNIFLQLNLIAAPLYAAIFLDEVLYPGITAEMLSPLGICAITLGAIVYAGTRRTLLHD